MFMSHRLEIVMKNVANFVLAMSLVLVGCGEDISKTSKKASGSEPIPTKADSPNNTNVIDTPTSMCGNGRLDFGEACDGTVAQTCAELGFDDGAPSCNDDCTANTDACVRYSCGDGELQGDEACDDGALNGQAGYCNTNCSGQYAFCGDGIVSANESCDGETTTTCQDLGFERGTVECGACAFDTSGCSTCGDGIVGQDELCDDGALNGTYGHCNATCDAQGAFCGDGVLQASEQCDGGVPAGTSCESLGLGRGTITCSEGCTLMTSCTMAPMQGELVFTEVMADPNVNSDNDGEWFEMRNVTSRVIDLSGCMIESSTSTGMESFTISSLVAQPGQYLTFARSVNAPFTASYTYNANINLNNTTDSLALYCNSGTSNVLVDQVAYDNGATFPDPTGASISLNPARVTAAQNDLGSNWCAASSVFGVGDLGTPGAPNDACF